jgi:FtsH-binding integral membrane protein
MSNQTIENGKISFKLPFCGLMILAPMFYFAFTAKKLTVGPSTVMLISWFIAFLIGIVFSIAVTRLAGKSFWSILAGMALIGYGAMTLIFLRGFYYFVLN